MTDVSNLILSILGTVFLGVLFLLFIMPKYVYNTFGIFKFPKVSTPAKLIDRTIFFEDEYNNEYLFVFQLYTGKRLTFKVDSTTYSHYYIGDKGILVYRGEKFLHFDKKF